MAIDTSVPRSRRALLAVGIGGLAALAASALGRPLPVSAGSDGDVVLADYNTAKATTTIDTSSTAEDSLFVKASGGRGLTGQATAGIGVWGEGANTGVLGISLNGQGFGVRGISESPKAPGIRGASCANSGGVVGWSFANGNPSVIPATPAKTGVFGYAAQDTDARGVTGETTSGRGVSGIATAGTGLHGQATTGYALRTSGRIKVGKASGVATIAATQSSVVITPGLDVTTSSFVLLTAKADLGTRRLW